MPLVSCADPKLGWFLVFEENIWFALEVQRG